MPDLPETGVPDPGPGLAADRPAFDSEEWRRERNARLFEWFKGNESAFEFFIMVSDLTETWDDLIDGDPVAADRVHRAFWTLLWSLPMNEFYKTHSSFFWPMLLQAANAYQDSIVLEGGNASDQAHAYTLRLLALQLIPMIALIIGGPDHMRNVSLESWRFFTEQDPIEGWKKW